MVAIKFGDFEVCDCECHSNPDVMHCMACCLPCPYCNAHIKYHYYDDHVVICSQMESFPKCTSGGELCDCEYHQSPVRCEPHCCKICPNCGFHIKEKHLASHLTTCQPK